MSRLTIFVTVQVFFSCLFVGAAPAEEVRPQKTMLRKSDAVNFAERIDRQIIIRTQLVEVSLSKMRRLGIEVFTFDGRNVQVFHDDDVSFGMKSSGYHFAMMEAMKNNGIARVLTEPTIATVDRRPASLSCGSNIKIGSRPNDDNVSETKFIGTKLKVVPQVVDSQRLYIEMHLDWSGIDDSSKADHNATPNINYYEIDTTIEATFGETFVLSGFVKKVRNGDQTEETTLVLMVTPAWADGTPAIEKKPLQVSQSTSHDSTRSK